MYNFNANSSNWVQRLGHNADFYNNPLGYNSSPTPRPYDNTTVFGADDDNEVISGFTLQTPRTTSLSNGFNVNKQQPSMGNIASFNLKGNNNTSNFNANSNNWVQRLGHNADFYNNPLGYNSSPTPRPYDNTTASGINNSFNINNRQPSLSGLESYNQPQKQQYTNPKVKPFTSWDIALSALEGFGEGAVGGTENIMNGLTLGGYGIVSDKLGLGMKERKTKLQLSSDYAGVGDVFNVTNKGTYLIGNGLLLYLLRSKGIPAIRQAYNIYNIFNGSRNLANQLHRGSNFKDIYMGKIDKNKFNQINDIRLGLGEAPILSRQVKIPKQNVQHIWDRRINIGQSKPREVANYVKDSIFSKDSQVFPGNVSRNQVIIKTGDKHPSMSVISKDDIFDGISVRSSMQKDLPSLLKKYPDLKY